MNPLRKRSALALAIGALTLAACASAPVGPSVLVLPGSSKSFDQFRLDEIDCRQYASQSSGGQTAENAQTESALKSAAIGTAIGAAAGALMNGSSGAGVGAGAGLLAGGLFGTSASSQSAYTLQRRYDNAYQQCMYAKGNRIPAYGMRSTSTSTAATVRSSDSAAYPPPPPPPSGTPAALPPAVHATDTSRPAPPDGMPPPPPPSVVTH